MSRPSTKCCSPQWIFWFSVPRSSSAAVVRVHDAGEVVRLQVVEQERRRQGARQLLARVARPIIGRFGAVLLAPAEEEVEDLGRLNLGGPGDLDGSLLGRLGHQLVVEPVGFRLIGGEAVLLGADLDVEATGLLSPERLWNSFGHGAKNP